MTKDELWDLNLKISATQSMAKDDKWMADSDWEEFILLMNLKNPQSYGSLIQNRIIKVMNGDKVKPSLNRGDIKINNEYFEIKASILTPTNKVMNLVQIRLWQDIAGYCCFAFDVRVKNNFQIHQYYLTHDEMVSEVELLGSSAHGTKIITAENKHNEKAIRIAIEDSDPNFMRWNSIYKHQML
jgi:hypothetical protein